MRRRDLLLRLGVAGLAGTAAAGPARGRATSTAAPGAGTGVAPLGSLPVAGAREAVVGPDGVTVFVAGLDGFAVVDVSAPADPRLLAERRGLLPDAPGGPLGGVQEVAVDGDRLLVVGPAHPQTDAVYAALLYDVSDPADPHRLAVHETEYPIHNGALRDGRAFLTANDDETNPLEVVEMEGGGAGPSVLGRWSVVDEDEAWARVPAPVRPLHDVTVEGDVAYCSCWDAGTWLVDVSDPSEPRALGHLGERSPDALAAVADAGVESTELPGNHHSAAVDGPGDLVAVGHEAWDADSDGAGGPGGVTLVDVSAPESPERLATIAPPPTADPSRRGVWTTAHNADLRAGRLYSAWYQGGVRVHDVSDPRAPREVATWRDVETARFWTAVRATDAVVASSMGTETGEPGLYTFPVPDETKRRPAVGPPPTSSPRTSTAARQVTATPGMAGFGAAVTLLGGGLAWLLARRDRG